MPELRGSELRDLKTQNRALKDQYNQEILRRSRLEQKVREILQAVEDLKKMVRWDDE